MCSTSSSPPTCVWRRMARQDNASIFDDRNFSKILTASWSRCQSQASGTACTTFYKILIRFLATFCFSSNVDVEDFFRGFSFLLSRYFNRSTWCAASSIRWQRSIWPLSAKLPSVRRMESMFLRRSSSLSFRKSSAKWYRQTYRRRRAPTASRQSPSSSRSLDRSSCGWTGNRSPTDWMSNLWRLSTFSFASPVVGTVTFCGRRYNSLCHRRRRRLRCCASKRSCLFWKNSTGFGAAFSDSSHFVLTEHPRRYRRSRNRQSWISFASEPLAKQLLHVRDQIL